MMKKPILLVSYLGDDFWIRVEALIARGDKRVDICCIKLPAIETAGKEVSFFLTDEYEIKGELV